MSLKDATAKVREDMKSTSRPSKRQATDPAPSPRARTDAAALPWDQRMKRHTFHVPVDLLDELRSVSDRTGLSHAQIVRDALASYLPTIDK